MEIRELYIDMCVEKFHKYLIDRYNDESDSWDEYPTPEDRQQHREFYGRFVDALEIHMAKQEMCLYTDIVLVPVNTIKRMLSITLEKSGYNVFRTHMMFGHPYTSFDDRAGYVQIKLDFTLPTITKIN